MTDYRGTPTQRRRQIEADLALYRRMFDTIRDVGTPAAKQHRDDLERKLVALRRERRRLDWRCGDV